MVIYLPNAPPINGDDPASKYVEYQTYFNSLTHLHLYSSATFQLEYTQKHTRIFIDQVFSGMTSGFVPNTNDADPNFGYCLQCAAVDRARLQVSPTIPRSSFCSKCFEQYCYDEANPPSVSQLPGRKYEFVDPDPQGTLSFLKRNKFKLLGGLIGLVVFISALVVGLIWWRKRKQRVQYQKIQSMHGADGDSYKQFVRPQSVYELPDFRGGR